MSLDLAKVFNCESHQQSNIIYVLINKQDMSTQVLVRQTYHTWHLKFGKDMILRFVLCQLMELLIED